MKKLTRRERKAQHKVQTTKPVPKVVTPIDEHSVFLTYLKSVYQDSGHINKTENIMQDLYLISYYLKFTDATKDSKLLDYMMFLREAKHVIYPDLDEKLKRRKRLTSHFYMNIPKTVDDLLNQMNKD